MEKTTTYCDLLESDDYYVSDTFIFQSQIFRTYNPRQYAYEHSLAIRNDSLRSTPPGRQWANVWDQIESNQNRAPGKRRNRYHISWQSKRVTQPGMTENVPTTVEKVNPLDGEKLRFTTYEKRETPPVFAPVEMLYFDIDDMDEVDAFKNLPSAIWTRSPSGRHHVFVLIYPGDYQRVRERVAEWMYRNEIRSENNIIPRSGTTLNSILIPGQDDWTLPCKPGQPEESIASDYQETMALFADHYQNKRLDIDAAFPFSREISKPVQIADTEPVTITETKTPSPIYKVKAKAKRNRPRLGSRCNIPGITGALRITRAKGTLDEQTFEYRTIDDCLDEPNGFHIAWPYFAALLRKYRGDGDAAYSDFVNNRQLLRTLSSKKHHRHSYLLQDARAMKRYGVRMYNPKMMKHSERNKQDAEAMESVNLIAPHSYAVVIQSLLQTNKTAIVGQHGKRAYQTVQSIVHHVTSDILTNNGRIAQRSKKSRKEYTFADSRTMIDYPGIDGDKHLLCSVVQILRQYVLSISDPHDWSEAKCTRWTYQDQIIDKAKEEAIPKGTKETKKGFLSLTNVGPSMPGWLEPYPQDDALIGVIDGILSDLGPKVMETIEPTSPE